MQRLWNSITGVIAQANATTSADASAPDTVGMISSLLLSSSSFQLSGIGGWLSLLLFGETCRRLWGKVVSNFWITVTVDDWDTAYGAFRRFTPCLRLAYICARRLVVVLALQPTAMGLRSAAPNLRRAERSQEIDAHTISRQ
jgi:hypothetical protein